MSNLFSIEGKTALVTGGSRGIGKMIATGFVEAGAKVYISSRKAAVCEAVAAELSAIGTCIALPEDLSSEEGCARLAAALGEREDHLDILVSHILKLDTHHDILLSRFLLIEGDRTYLHKEPMIGDRLTHSDISCEAQDRGGYNNDNNEYSNCSQNS